MNIAIPHTFFKLLENDANSFICMGDVNDEQIEKTIRLGEQSIRSIAGYNRIKKKISFLISECLQNLIKYEEKPKVLHQTNNRPGAFMVRNIGNSYYVFSSNLIKEEKVKGLKTRLTRLNELDSDELKRMQEEIYADKKNMEKGNSGFGLIEMTRRSGNRLEYDFEYVNFYLFCFYLKVKLTIRGEASEVKSASLDNAKNIFREVLNKNCMLLYKGDFSQQSMLPVLGTIETNLKRDSEQYSARKKVFYFVVELLQNMSKHASEKNGSRQGIMAICKKGKEYNIYSGNFISPAKVDELKSYLERINNMTKDQLSALYKEHLFDGKKRTKGGAGLGLIDMLRYSKHKPVFDFRPYDNESVFYSFGFSI